MKVITELPQYGMYWYVAVEAKETVVSRHNTTA